MWILTGVGEINSPYKSNADFLDIIKLVDIIEKQQETILRQMKVIEKLKDKENQKDIQADGPVECADAAGA